MMRKASNGGQTAKDTKEVSQILKAIRQLIKVECYREQARQMLDKLDLSSLTSDQKVTYLYLNGRYHYYLFKEYEDIDPLEWANDYLDDMASYAYKHKVPTELPMIYTRAYVKYLLAGLVWDEDRKPWLLQKADHITETSLKFHPDNSSFLWLKSQLEA